MSTLSWRDTIMQTVFIEIMPDYLARIQLLRAHPLYEGDKISEEDFLREHVEIVKNTQLWLWDNHGVNPVCAFCMILTAARLIWYREDLLEFSPCDPDHQPSEFAALVSREVAQIMSCFGAECSEVMQVHLHHYVILLLNRYDYSSTEDASELDKDKGILSFVCPTPAKQKVAVSERDEPQVMQALFHKMWKELKKLITQYKCNAISWEELIQQWSVTVAPEAYSWLTECYAYGAIDASCMVHVVGLLIRQQLGVAPRQSFSDRERYMEQVIKLFLRQQLGKVPCLPAVEHYEAKLARDLAEAVVSALPKKRRTRGIKKKVYNRITRLLVEYQGKLRHQNKRRGGGRRRRHRS